MVAPGRAANIPEFVQLPPGAIVKIREEFLDDYSYTRAGNEFYRAGDAAHAMEKYQIALAMNPDNAMAHQRLGFLLYRTQNRLLEAHEHLDKAVQLEPNNAFARSDLGTVLMIGGDLSNAVVHLAEAVRLLPNGFDRQYNVIDMNLQLAEVNCRLNRFSNCLPALKMVLQRAPEHGRANFLMAMAMAWLGETEATSSYFENATKADPGLLQVPDYYDLLSRNYAREGRFAQSLKAAEKGYQLAVAAGRADQAARLRQLADYCRKQK
jgi:tetratricopeptide (TPR) repeat protein